MQSAMIIYPGEFPLPSELALARVRSSVVSFVGHILLEVDHRPSRDQMLTRARIVLSSLQF